MSHYAIVKVIDSEYLEDGSGKRRRHARRGALEAGAFYAVLWPDDTAEPPYRTPRAFYCGPYRTSLLACLDYLRHRDAYGAWVAAGGGRAATAALDPAGLAAHQPRLDARGFVRRAEI